MKAESKYTPLYEYLRQTSQAEIVLTFIEIEQLLKDELPVSARTQRGWWSNRSSGALQARAWLESGHVVDGVDLEHERVTFRKPVRNYAVRHSADNMDWNNETIKALRQHMGLTQAELAVELGVRQQTVSEWEKGIYTPTRATSKYLTRIAEQAGFYQTKQD